MYEWLYRDPPPEFIPSLGKYASDGEYWPGIDKLLHFAGLDEHGRPQLCAIDSSASGYGLTKMAAQFPAGFMDAVSNLDPDPDKVYVAGNALGAMESWSSNKNGDAFPRMGLMNSDPDTYGHKTFEKHAHVYTHHQNKDPAKSIGKVTHAFWDDDMDKVLLLFYLLKSKAPHLVDRLEKGDTFDTSMGCKCPFDVCSNCGNKAPTRDKYCQHLKYFINQILPDGLKNMAVTPHPRFFDQSGVLKGADPIAKALTIIDKNGAAKHAWEHRPKHFVMSKAAIWTPGSTHMRCTKLAAGDLDVEELRQHVQPGVFGARVEPSQDSPFQVLVGRGKVAYYFPSRELAAGFQKAWTSEHPYDPADGPFKKNAELKAADINKQVPGMAQAIDPKVERFAKSSLPLLERSAPPIDREKLDNLSDSGTLGEILSSLLADGIILSPEEFRRVMMNQHGAKEQANALDDQGIKQPREGKGEGLSEEEQEEVRPRQEKVRKEIREKISQLVPQRSAFQPYLYKRAIDLLSLLGRAKSDSSLPSGAKIIVILPSGDHDDRKPNPLSALLGAGGGPASSRSLPQMPQMLPAMLAIQALYNAYRTNLGQADIHKAFDDPVTLSDIMKQGSLSSSSYMGVPTRAYLKYAFNNPYEWEPEIILAPGEEVLCEDPLMVSAVAGVLGDGEKVASIIEAGYPELVDTATVMSLRFSSGALKGLLSRR